MAMAMTTFLSNQDSHIPIMITYKLASLLADYIFHTAAAKASGELCLNYIFSFGALARTPLVDRYGCSEASFSIGNDTSEL